MSRSSSHVRFVVHAATGEVEEIEFKPRTRASGSKVTVQAIHEHLTRDAIRDFGRISSRDPMLGLGLWFGGLDRIGRHRLALRKREVPWSAELAPPQGQAAYWYDHARREVSLSGQRVAHQLARLCGEDSQVVIPWRSLADAVGHRDKGGRLRAYTEGGVEVLTRAGWLEVKTVGRGRGAMTTFSLLPGPG